MIWNHVMNDLPKQSGFYVAKYYTPDSNKHQMYTAPIYWDNDRVEWLSWRLDNVDPPNVKEWAPETHSEFYGECYDKAETIWTEDDGR